MNKVISKGNIKVVINGKEASATCGETILDVARREKIHIPTLCHDPRLKPFSSCFLCVVGVKGMKGLQPSCSTPVSPDMVITTENPAILNARKTALDLLLSNHYADCLGPCKLNCPAGVDVQGYISLIEKGLYSEAVSLIKETNPLPAICGRVCVRPCELVCRRNLLEEGKGVGIDYLKRFAADMDLASAEPYQPDPEPRTDRKVAIIGAGPAGLSAAWWLQLKGHECHIFESAPLPGGWLRYGIPEYRLPNDILDAEVKAITNLGVKIFCNTRLGKDIRYEAINRQYDAMILSPGSQMGTRLGCEGDEAEGVMPGIDFLRDMEMTGQRPGLSGKKVVVVGGGNTAMDCCRSAVRCGAEDVTVIYRRTEKEMPANPIEIEESKREGVKYMFLTNPVKVISDKKGRIDHIIAVRMELGEPDDSGRRRPVTVPGSEFVVGADLILAAIGQKTDLSFIDDINRNTKLGELKRNRWGDIEVNPQTLETGVANIFAAGDAVTGPDTIIGAIAQARVAANSCHQYLSGLPVKSLPGLFVSRRDNFRPPSSNDLPQRFTHKPRHEMPLLATGDRRTFKEVELGYPDEMTVRDEASRCLECGCVAFHDCDLQRYATEYAAEQKKYKGEFTALPPDDTHPFISFEPNKCILCGRCVRICHELAGADALGFIHRGFRTVVGPGPGLKLTDTFCSSCGLCISTCPTGAITENTPFKPGPVETESFVTPDFIGSEGASVRIHHRKGFYTAAEGSAGIVNPDASVGREARFSYRLLNTARLTKPLLRVNGSFKEISFEEASAIIAEKIKNAVTGENAYFAGGTLTNEELFLIDRMAKRDPALGFMGSFQYMIRPEASKHKAFTDISDINLPVSEVEKAEALFIFGTDLFERHQLTGFRVFNKSFKGETSVTLITEVNNPRMERKADRVIKTTSRYHFIKAAIRKILDHNLQNDIFIKTRCCGFEQYREKVMACSYDSLVRQAGTDDKTVSAFVEGYNTEMKAILIFADEDISRAAGAELRNLALLVGKAGKEGAGILCLRQSCNSQGLIDRGLAKSSIFDFPDSIKNLFIFGEDPLGHATPEKIRIQLPAGTKFVVVQDSRMTETAKQADLVLPSTFIFESGGSFTSTGRMLNTTAKSVNGPVALTGSEQVSLIMNQLGYNQNGVTENVSDEMFGSFACSGNNPFRFEHTEQDDSRATYGIGCNSLHALFEAMIVRVE